MMTVRQLARSLMYVGTVGSLSTPSLRGSLACSPTLPGLLVSVPFPVPPQVCSSAAEKGLGMGMGANVVQRWSKLRSSENPRALEPKYPSLFPKRLSTSKVAQLVLSLLVTA